MGTSKTSSKKPTTGPTFATKVVHKEEDVVLTQAQFSKADHAAVSAEDKLKISSGACTGSKQKLSKIDYTKMASSSEMTDFSDDQFDKMIMIATFLSNMKQHFICYDMAHWFMYFPILEKNTSGDPDKEHDRNKGKTVNLFDRWNQISLKKDHILDTIADVTGWIHVFTDKGSEAYLKDLEWTHKYLMDSMDEDLKTAVQSRLDEEFKAHQQGGPLTFAVMIDLAVNLLSTMITNIQSAIRGYDIKKVPGESIDLVCRRFCHVFKALENNNALTNDLIQQLFKVFSTTSVDCFNNLIEQWENNIVLGGDPIPPYEEIFKKATAFYTHLNVMGHWASSTTASMFKAKEVICHNCGKPGHIQPNCPHLEHQPGTPSNEWTTPPQASMKVSSSPDCYSKTIRGKKVHWCCKCRGRGCWTTTHHTDEHHGGNPSHKANLAQGSEGEVKEDESKDASKLNQGMSFKDSLLAAANSD